MYNSEENFYLDWAMYDDEKSEEDLYYEDLLRNFDLQECRSMKLLKDFNSIRIAEMRNPEISLFIGK